MSVLVSAATLAAIIVLAVKGYGYRGLYFAVAVAALGFGWIVVQMIPSAQELLMAENPKLGEATLAAGTLFEGEYFPPFAFWLFSVAFGSLIAGCAFRART